MVRATGRPKKVRTDPTRIGPGSLGGSLEMSRSRQTSRFRVVGVEADDRGLGVEGGFLGGVRAPRASASWAASWAASDASAAVRGLGAGCFGVAGIGGRSLAAPRKQAEQEEQRGVGEAVTGTQDLSWSTV